MNNILSYSEFINEGSYSNDLILDKFLIELSKLGKLYRNPMNKNELIYNDNIVLEFDRFDKQNKKEVNLKDMMSLDKRKGIGSSTMCNIINVADDLNYDLTLYAKPFGHNAMPMEILIKFYKSFGFITMPDQYGTDDVEEIEDYVISEPDEGLEMIRKYK